MNDFKQKIRCDENKKRLIDAEKLRNISTALAVELTSGHIPAKDQALIKTLARRFRETSKNFQK